MPQHDDTPHGDPPEDPVVVGSLDCETPEIRAVVLNLLAARRATSDLLALVRSLDPEDAATVRQCVAALLARPWISCIATDRDPADQLASAVPIDVRIYGFLPVIPYAFN